MNYDVKSLLQSAVEKGVQDIYIIPRRKRYDIYYRIEEERSICLLKMIVAESTTIIA